MLQVIKEVREEDEASKDLNMRIGIHTGEVVAGFIGSKLVRYDIFGEGVLIANKMESHGEAGAVCISEDTKRVLHSNPMFEQHFEYHKYT